MFSPPQFHSKYHWFEFMEQKESQFRRAIKAGFQNLYRAVPIKSINGGRFTLPRTLRTVFYFLQDLEWTIRVRYPDFGYSKEMNQKRLLSQLFLCLSAADSTRWPIHDSLLLFHHIQIQARYRSACIALYNAFQGCAKAFGLSQEEYVDMIVDLSYGASKPALRSGPLRRALRRGQRWSDLSLMFGDAIILLGTPGRNDLLYLDIPCIVEHATNEGFEFVKKLLNTYFWWLRAACENLLFVHTEILKQQGLATQEYAASIRSKFSELFSLPQPFHSVLAEIRPILNIQSPQLFISQMLISTPEQPEDILTDLLCCINAIMDEIMAQKWSLDSATFCHAAALRVSQFRMDCISLQDNNYYSCIRRMLSAATWADFD